MLDIKRREFIALVGGGGLLLAAEAKRARAQQPKLPTVGFLGDHGFGPEPMDRRFCTTIARTRLG